MPRYRRRLIATWQSYARPSRSPRRAGSCAERDEGDIQKIWRQRGHNFLSCLPQRVVSRSLTSRYFSSIAIFTICSPGVVGLCSGIAQRDAVHDILPLCHFAKDRIFAIQKIAPAQW